MICSVILCMILMLIVCVVMVQDWVLDGMDLVLYMQDGVVVLGCMDFVIMWCGEVWYFVIEQNCNQFEVNFKVYVFGLGGLCVVVLFEGWFELGNLCFFVVIGQCIYFLCLEQVCEWFLVDLQGVLMWVKVVWVKLYF